MIATDYIKHNAYKLNETKQSYQKENNFKNLHLVSPRQGLF